MDMVDEDGTEWRSRSRSSISRHAPVFRTGILAVYIRVNMQRSTRSMMMVQPGGVVAMIHKWMLMMNEELLRKRVELGFFKCV